MTASPKRQLAIVLHTHMPYVEGFGTWPFGEEWLWEAIATCYLPLLDLLNQGAPLTLSLTPVLGDQLQAPGIQTRFSDFLQTVRRETHRLDIQTAQSNNEAAVAEALEHSAEQYLQAQQRWQQLDGNLLAALAPYVRWTSSATHAILPLLASDRGINLQIQTGIESHLQRFDRQWHGGFWLPECAYAPWLDELLVDAGVKTIAVDLTDHFGYGNQRHLQPLQNPSGLQLAPIDRQTMELAWSKNGYPAHPAYRDHHRLSEHDHRAWANDGTPYDQDRAQHTAKEHASQFVEAVKTRLTGGGLLVCPFDTEFFGHWWHEGITWLEHVVSETKRQGVELIQLDEAVIQTQPTRATEELPISSWGQNRDLSTWDQPAVAKLVWEAKTLELQTLHSAQPPSQRALRELLALQSSDWAFLVTQAYAASYGHKRAQHHAAMLQNAQNNQELEDSLRNLAPFIKT